MLNETLLEDIKFETVISPAYLCADFTDYGKICIKFSSRVSKNSSFK